MVGESARGLAGEPGGGLGEVGIADMLVVIDDIQNWYDL